jgi:hypothetical protein
LTFLFDKSINKNGYLFPLINLKSYLISLLFFWHLKPLFLNNFKEGFKVSPKATAIAAVWFVVARLCPGNTALSIFSAKSYLFSPLLVTIIIAPPVLFKVLCCCHNNISKFTGEG